MRKPRASDAANHFQKFPTVDSAVADDFTVFPTFVPTDTLQHLKNFGKDTRKSADAVAEFASPIKGSEYFHLLTNSKCV